MKLSLSLFLCYNALIATVLSEVIVYDRHVVFPDRPEFLVVPKFAKQDIISMQPGRGRSYIDFSRLKVKTTCNPDGTHRDPPAPPGEDDVCRDTLFEMLMFEAPEDKPWFDYWDQDNFCCTEELIADGVLV